MSLIVPIVTLLVIQATAGLCPKNASTFTLELRDEIIDALNDTGDTEELQCVEAESE